MLSLTPDKARIFRITHIDNIPWAIANGLHCRNSGERDPNFKEIGNPDIISKRTSKSVPIGPGGTLSDYIPFYFTPYSPMLLNIKTGYGGVRRVPMQDIVILVSSLPALTAKGIRWVFSNQHALLEVAEFFGDMAHIHRIDWPLLQARDFRRSPEDPGKVDRYMAEALVHGRLMLADLAGMVCYGPDQEKKLKLMYDPGGSGLQIVSRPDWYH